MKLSTARRALTATGAVALVLVIGVGSVAAAGPRSAAARSHAGLCDGTVATQAAPSGALTAAQAAALAGMAEEEKLALDLYTAFAARYPSPAWDNIATAEAAHLAAIRTLLARYGIADPTAGRGAGSFASPQVAALYSNLLADGSVSEAAASGVGRTVELDDIARLDAARSNATASDVLRVYANLRRASTQHLAAFDRLLAR
jgi:hypothetical protein